METEHTDKDADEEDESGEEHVVLHVDHELGDRMAINGCDDD